MSHSYCLFETGIGTCAVAWTERGLKRVQLPDTDATATERHVSGEAGRSSRTDPPPSILECVQLLQAYFRGDRIDFRGVRLDDEGISQFNTKIYRALSEVAYGTTTTYGALARSVGAPGASRAVGVAMARNPWPIVIPCHRVLASGQRIGGFSAPGGQMTKERLLTLEGSSVVDGTPLLPGLLYPIR